MLMNILIPVLLFTGLGLAAGLLLSVFSKIFAVDSDEKVEEVLSALPGVNCGACGFSGCESYAREVVHNGAATNRCVPGGAGAAEKISAIMGTEAQSVARQVAFVSCSGVVPKVTADSYIYEGEKTCAACSLYYQGRGVCDWGCIGFGDCAKQCAFDAISIVDECAVVNPDRCTGCTLCTKACPKSLIHIRDLTKTVYVSCSSCESGRDVVKQCQVGCIACHKCEKVCPSDAIHVVNNVAVIDYTKCTNCHACAENCPRHCIEIL